MRPAARRAPTRRCATSRSSSTRCPQALIRSQNATHAVRCAAQRARHQLRRRAKAARRRTRCSTCAASRPTATSSSTASATSASTTATCSPPSRSRCSRAPSALMFGRGSTGGVINQISQGRRPVRPRSEVGADARLVRPEAPRPPTSTCAPATSSALRLVALGEDSGSYRYPQDVERYGFAPSFRSASAQPTESRSRTTTSRPRTSPTTASRRCRPRHRHRLLRRCRRCRRATTTATRTTTTPTTRPTSRTATHRRIASATTLTLRNTLRWANYERQVGVDDRHADARPTSTARRHADHAARRCCVVTRNHDTGRTRDNDDDALINQTELMWRLRPAA